MMKHVMRAAALAALMAGCGGGGDASPPVPVIFDYGPSSANSYTWDGSAWQLSAKVYFGYDGETKLTSMSAEADFFGSWIEVMSETNTYVAENRIQRMDATTFIGDARTDYFYDAQDRLEYVENYSDTGSGMELNGKTEYAYDMQDRLATRTDYTWDGSAYTESEQVSYTYDANNRVTEAVTYYWTGSAWSELDKEEYTYDVAGILITRTRYSYSGGWLEDEKDEFSYNADGTNDEITTWVYSAGWEPSEETRYGFNAEGRLTSVTTCTWNGSDWDYAEKMEFTMTGNASSYTYEGASFPEPISAWMLEFYGQGELNRYAWP